MSRCWIRWTSNANAASPLRATRSRSIIARTTVAPYRNDVTEKLYGGNVTPKKKLLEKQEKGKAKMKQFGSLNIPQ